MVLNDIDQDGIEEDLIESCLQCSENINGLAPSPIRQLQNNKHFFGLSTYQRTFQLLFLSLSYNDSLFNVFMKLEKYHDHIFLH